MICSRPSCDTILTNRSQQYCKLHNPKICWVDSCKIFPTFGYDDHHPRPSHCTIHRLPSMINIRERKCIAIGCGKSQTIRMVANAHRGLCGAHVIERYGRGALVSRPYVSRSVIHVEPETKSETEPPRSIDQSETEISNTNEPIAMSESESESVSESESESVSESESESEVQDMQGYKQYQLIFPERRTTYVNPDYDFSDWHSPGNTIYDKFGYYSYSL